MTSMRDSWLNAVAEITTDPDKEAEVLMQLGLPTKKEFGIGGWTVQSIKLVAKKLQLHSNRNTEEDYEKNVSINKVGEMKKFVVKHIPSSKKRSATVMRAAQVDMQAEKRARILPHPAPGSAPVNPVAGASGAFDMDSLNQALSAFLPIMKLIAENPDLLLLDEFKVANECVKNIQENRAFQLWSAMSLSQRIEKPFTGDPVLEDLEQPISPNFGAILALPFGKDVDRVLEKAVTLQVVWVRKVDVPSVDNLKKKRMIVWFLDGAGKCVIGNLAASVVQQYGHVLNPGCIVKIFGGYIVSLLPPPVSEKDYRVHIFVRELLPLVRGPDKWQPETDPNKNMVEIEPDNVSGWLGRSIVLPFEAERQSNRSGHGSQDGRAHSGEPMVGDDEIAGTSDADSTIPFVATGTVAVAVAVAAAAAAANVDSGCSGIDDRGQGRESGGGGSSGGGGGSSGGGGGSSGGGGGAPSPGPDNGDGGSNSGGVGAPSSPPRAPPGPPTPSPPPSPGAAGVRGTGKGPIVIHRQLLGTFEPLCDVSGKFPLKDREFPIRCDGTLCSTERRYFRGCLALGIPPGDVPPDAFFEHYPWYVADRTAHDSLRAAAYYTTATQYYDTVGFANRMEHGLCVASKIRETWPNMKNTKYAGHKDFDINRYLNP